MGLRDTDGTLLMDEDDIDVITGTVTISSGITDTDSGEGNNARLVVEAKTTGTYIINPQTQNTDGSGTYTLSIVRTK